MPSIDQTRNATTGTERRIITDESDIQTCIDGVVDWEVRCASVSPLQGSADWNSEPWGGAPDGRSAPGWFVVPFQGGGLDAIVES